MSETPIYTSKSSIKSLWQEYRFYDRLGRHADAFRLYQETLALQKAKFGPDHPHTLGSMNNLANSYAARGRHADALKLREETLALRKAKLDPDHPDTLSSMVARADSLGCARSRRRGHPDHR